MSKKRILFVGEFSQLATGFATYMGHVIPELFKTGEYELAELATYCHKYHPKLEGVPWKVYPNEPDPNNPEENKLFSQNKLNQFGLWKFHEVLLDFKPDLVCVPPGELVLTKNGYVPIEEIKVGDFVLTHKNRYRKVLKTFKKQYNGIVRDIFSNGCCDALRVTDEHPVLVYKKRRQTNQRKSIRLIYDGIEPIFVPSKNVQEGDLLVLPKLPTSEDMSILDLSEYVHQFREENGKLFSLHHDKTGVNRFVKLDNNFSRLIGYLIGDGHLNRGLVNIAFGSHETRFIEDAKNIFETYLGCKVKIEKIKDKNMTMVCVFSNILSQILTNFIGYRTRTKFIPNMILNGSTEVKEGIIAGLIRSDGCTRWNTVTFCSVNKRLAYEYRALSISLNIPVNIQYIKSKQAYQVDGYGTSAETLRKIVDKYHFEVTESEKICRRTHIINNHMVASVRRCRNINYSGQVYNLEVEEDNSYVLQWCVHNCDIRDEWMQGFIQQSPYRKYFKYIHMPTIDGEPQKEEWLASYKEVDTLLTYSYWAKNLLEREYNGTKKIFDVASPGTDTEIFKPIDKKEARAKFGITGDIFIIQTVMRNQPRKLFPELMRAFNRYLQICKEKGREDLVQKTFLHFHTTNPDLGWDLPTEIRNHGLAHKVLFTYMCDACGAFGPSFYQGDRTICRNCFNSSLRLPNTAIGLTRDQLAQMMQLADLYIQYSVAEGWSLPPNDAKSCGIPAMLVENSAMYEQCHAPGGIPIPVEKHMQESVGQTGQLRALPDNEATAQSMFKFFSETQEYRDKMGQEARDWVIKNYKWENIAKIWKRAIDSTPILDRKTTWDSPPRIIKSVQPPKPNMTNEELVRWAMIDVLAKPSMFAELGPRLIQYLNQGFEQFQLEDGRMSQRPFTRNEFVQFFMGQVQQNNMLEQSRCSVKEDKPKVQVFRV